MFRFWIEASCGRFDEAGAGSSVFWPCLRAEGFQRLSYFGAIHPQGDPNLGDRWRPGDLSWPIGDPVGSQHKALKKSAAKFKCKNLLQAQLFPQIHNNPYTNPTNTSSPKCHGLCRAFTCVWCSEGTAELHLKPLPNEIWRTRSPLWRSLTHWWQTRLDWHQINPNNLNVSAETQCHRMPMQ